MIAIVISSGFLSVPTIAARKSRLAFHLPTMIFSRPGHMKNGSLSPSLPTDYQWQSKKNLICINLSPPYSRNVYADGCVRLKPTFPKLPAA